MPITSSRPLVTAPHRSMVAAREGTRALWREARRSPGQFTVILSTLVLVMAGSTIVFAVAAGTVWRPLPVPDAKRLVVLGESNPARGYDNVSAAPANVMDWRRRLQTVADVAFYNEQASQLPLALADGATVVRAVRVSGNFLSVAGVQPALGGTLTFDDTWAESAPVVMLGDGLWRRAFGADPRIVGRTIRLDGFAYDVRGVLPPGFDIGLGDVDAWVPMRWESSRQGTRWFQQARVVRPVARLAAGATLDQLRAELTTLDGQLAIERPETNAGWSARAMPIAGFLAGDRPTAAALFLTAALFLQLLGCANVGAVLLTRSLERRREHALREALGASRGHSVATSFVEAALLATIGAGGGIVLAMAGLRGLESARLDAFQNLAIHLDARVLAFVALVSGASAILFGLAPALGLRTVQPAEELASGGRTATIGARPLRMMHLVLGVEVALAVTLALGAGAMMRGLQRLQNVSIGSDTANVLAFAVNAPSGIYGEDEMRERMVAGLVERLAALPGVVAAAASRQQPLDGFGWTSDFTIDAWPADRFGLDVRHRQMTASYFPTLRIPLLSGRLFEDRLRNGQPFEVVVNQAYADRYFPGVDPVGHRVTFSRTRDADADWHPIVGVVGDERMSIRQPPMAEILGPLMSDMPGIPHVLVRAAGSPAALAPSVRAVIAQVDPQIALAGVRSMDDAVARALAVERFAVVLLGVFAAIGLLLAAVAVHGLTAQVVRSRAEELRIRKVLGATDGTVVATILRPLVVILLGGLGLGVAGASAASRMAHAYWFGPPPMEAGVIAWALAWLTLAAVLGTVVPIRQAIRVAPAGGV